MRKLPEVDAPVKKPKLSVAGGGAAADGGGGDANPGGGGEGGGDGGGGHDITDVSFRDSCTSARFFLLL